MKTRYLALISLGISVGLGFVIAQPPGGRGPQQPKTDLAKIMDSNNDAYKALGAEKEADFTVAAKKDAALAQIATLRSNMTKALELQPDYTKAQPEDKKTEFVDDFHGTLQQFLASLDQFEAAVRAGNTAEASRLYEALDQIHRDGHGKFRAPRGGGPGRGGPGGPGGFGGRGGPGGGFGGPGGPGN